ncbi:MAG: hypothetical protein JNL05_04175 [Flavobacteriales bacterium]|nr:hypothetical protein [Flavobacteriales bacterium]
MRMLIAGIAMIGLFSLPIGILIVLLCGAALTYSGGVEIDPAAQRLREYGGILGIRRGSWKSLTPFKHVAVLAVRRSGTVQGRAGGSTDLSGSNHDVVLLDAEHRKRFLIRACDTPHEARVLVDELVTGLGLTLVTYSPPAPAYRQRR